MIRNCIIFDFKLIGEVFDLMMIRTFDELVGAKLKQVYKASPWSTGKGFRNNTFETEIFEKDLVMIRAPNSLHFLPIVKNGSAQRKLTFKNIGIDFGISQPYYLYPC